MAEKIAFDKKRLGAFCQRHHIARLSLFGSILRGDFGPESDIDVLVEFQSAHVPGFFEFSRIRREVSQLFGGREIDLRTPEDLSRYFRQEVQAGRDPVCGLTIVSGCGTCWTPPAPP